MINDLLDTLGGMGTVGLCLAVALLAFGETAILMDLVVPGEVGMVIAGAAAVTGGHPVAPMIAAAALGALAGDTLSYGVGRRWGRLLIARFEVTRRRLEPLVDRADAYFASHGGAAVFLGRWVGALRAVVPFVAGLGHLRFRTFLAWNAAASLLWAAAAVGIGATFGRHVASAVDRLGTWLSVVVVLGGMLWLTVRARRRRSDPAG